MAEIEYKIAAGDRTSAYMDGQPCLVDFPPQYPDGFDTSQYSRLAQWHYPTRTSQLIRCEVRRRNLAGQLQSFGLASAHWDWPFMTWAKLEYLFSGIWSSGYDSALVTIRMPDYFGDEVSMVTYTGYGDFPFPEDTMKKRDSGQGRGYFTVRFDFRALSPA